MVEKFGVERYGVDAWGWKVKVEMSYNHWIQDRIGVNMYVNSVNVYVLNKSTDSNAVNFLPSDNLERELVQDVFVLILITILIVSIDRI